MSYFKRKLVRESLETGGVSSDVDYDYVDLNDTDDEITHLTIEGDVLSSDMEETHARYDALVDTPPSEFTETAYVATMVEQESIRQRWQIKKQIVASESMTTPNMRYNVARESLWEDIKEFFRKIRAWFSNLYDKLKARYIKFTNEGGKLIKKSKKYEEIVKKLGKRKEDKLSGDWIIKLTIKGKFDVVESFKSADHSLLGTSNLSIHAHRNIAQNIIAVKAKLGQIDGKSEEVRKKYNELGYYSRLMKESVDYFPGNMYFESKIENGEETYTFTELPDAKVDDEVPTPSTSELLTAISYCKKFGEVLQKSKLTWKANERWQRDTDNHFNELEALGDKLDSNEHKDTLATLRLSVSNARNIVSEANRAYAATVKNVGSGLPAYIEAAIKAYERK